MRKTFVTLAAATLFFSCSGDGETTGAPQELPVKITQWTGSGNMDYIKLLTYDSKNRLSVVDITQANATYNCRITYTYAPGKVTRNIDYTDAGLTDEKFVHYYNIAGIIREESYKNNALFHTYIWRNNLDGTKTTILKNAVGNVTRTFTYYFTSIGNLASIRVDEADPAVIDRTITFDGYDTNPRALFNHSWMEPWSYLPGTVKFPELPNNPTGYRNTPDGQTPTVRRTFDYQYNANGKVVFQKIFNAGSLINSIVYEYQTVE